MGRNKETITLLHICDYSAPYRGNFIGSLESMETYHDNIQNIYLFPPRAKYAESKNWISEMNNQQTVAYIQEENVLKNVLLFRQIIKKHKVDYIFRHFSDSRIDMIIKFLFNSKKVVRFFHCGYEEGSLLKHKLRCFFWKHNKLVGVSDFIADQVKQAFPGFFVSSVANAIFFERLDQTEPMIKPEGISLLMMGWDHKLKGVDLAIKAVWSLRKKYNLTLQIVRGQNEAEIQQLAKQITGENPSWVRCLPPTNSIGTYYTNNDIFLSPSRQEAFGYANIEAVYCKNSIVLSKVDGQGQLQIEGAYWFESENIQDFEKKLELAILEVATPEKIAQRERVKSQVAQIYSLEEWSNKVVALL